MSNYDNLIKMEKGDFPEPNHVFSVWEYNDLRKQDVIGVYIFRDIEGECLYIGKSGDGEEPMPKRVRNHIMGNTKESEKFQRYIHTVSLFTFSTDDKGHTLMKMCELHAKYSFPPMFSKDADTYDFSDTQLYNLNTRLLWENWIDNEDWKKDYDKLMETDFKKYIP